MASVHQGVEPNQRQVQHVYKMKNVLETDPFYVPALRDTRSLLPDCVPVYSLSSRRGWSTPEGSLWTGCSGFESSSGVYVQEVYPQFKYVSSGIAQFYIN
jgi:hypothetical protein